MAGSFFVGKRHSMLQSINNETRLNRIGENHTTYCRVGSAVVRSSLFINLSTFCVTYYESSLISSTHEGTVHRS